MSGNGDHGIVRSDFPGGWPGDKVNARTGEGLSTKQKETQAYFKKLLQWRKDKEVIHDGKLVHFLPKDNVYVYFRYDENEKVMVILNKGAQKNLELERFKELIGGVQSGTDVLSGKTYTFGTSIELPAKSPLILELK